MPRSGGAAILMQQSSSNISYIIGSEEILKQMQEYRSDQPFFEKRIEFLNLVSRYIMADKEAGNYPDVVTFAFWCRI